MNIQDVIYDRFGQPQIFLTNTGRFIDFSGIDLGFLQNGNVYNYGGNYVGWYENGVLRDKYGNVVGFGENPTDYPTPFLPIRAMRPAFPMVGTPPMKPMTFIPAIHFMKTFNWSTIDPIGLFN